MHTRQTGKGRNGARRKIVRGRRQRSVFNVTKRRALLLAAKKGSLKASGKKSHFDAAVHSAAVSRFLDTPKKSSQKKKGKYLVIVPNPVYSPLYSSLFLSFTLCKEGLPFDMLMIKENNSSAEFSNEKLVILYISSR